MEASDRKLAYSAIVVLAVAAAEFAYFLFVGPANHAPELGSPEFWTATFTAALTASTIGLWLQTKKLAVGAEDQARITRAAFQFAERANLGVIDWEIRYGRPGIPETFSDFAEGMIPIFSFKIANSGRTSATITEIIAQYKVAKKFDDSVKYTGRVTGLPATVFPGSKIQGRIIANTRDIGTFSAKEVADFKTNDLYVVAWGRIEFRDAFGDSCIVGFGVRLELLHKEFHVPVRRGYNYVTWSTDHPDFGRDLPPAYNSEPTGEELMVCAILV